MASALVSAGLLWLAIQVIALVLRYGFKVRQLVVGWATVSVQTTSFNRCAQSRRDNAILSACAKLRNFSSFLL